MWLSGDLTPEQQAEAKAEGKRLVDKLTAQLDAQHANQLFDTSVFSIYHPQGFLGPGGVFEPWTLPTKTVDTLGVTRYCPHFELLSNIATGCGVEKQKLASTDQYCGYFAKQDYTELHNMTGRQGVDYHRSCFCIRLYTALYACLQAMRALQKREDETPTQLLPGWIYGESNPSAIIAHKDEVQESVVKANTIHEALIIARVVTRGSANLEKPCERAIALLRGWKEEIRSRIIDLPEKKIYPFADMAPKLCSEAPPYRPFEGTVSLVD